MPTPKLYSQCQTCKGKNQIPDPTYKGHDPAYVTCPHCETGYNPVGITEGQLESIIAERDALLEFVARVADLGDKPAATDAEELDWYEAAIGLEVEARALVKDKGARVEEYRCRRDPTYKPKAPAPAPLPPA